MSAALVLAALASQALAGPFRHSQFHKRDVSVKRSTPELSATGAALLQKLHILEGKNTCPDGTGVSNTLEFFNNAAEEVVIVIWDSNIGYQSSFVGSSQPLVTRSIAPGESCTLNMDSTTSGAFAPVFPDTCMSQFGQIKQTWGEYTFDKYIGGFDVSREVYANGRNITMVGENGCTSDMNRCVFKCKDPSVDTCGQAGTYQLTNCNQPGSMVGTGYTDGGCSMGGKNYIKTTLC